MEVYNMDSMTYFYVMKDGQNIGRTGSRAAALDMIRQEQAQETHFMLRANFSIISGVEEHIAYKK
jgi:hypothetical protein